MKRILTGFLAGSVLIGACNNNRETTETELTTDSNSRTDAAVVDSTVSGCYSLATATDSASLQLQVKGSQASGTLSYNIAGKDRNDGTFDGEIRNGILAGWYLFRSEGLMSVRQVSWRIGTGALWPGHGEVEMRNDSTYFKDPGRLEYDSSRVFVKVPCVI